MTGNLALILFLHEIAGKGNNDEGAAIICKQHADLHLIWWWNEHCRRHKLAII